MYIRVILVGHAMHSREMKLQLEHWGADPTKIEGKDSPQCLLWGYPSSFPVIIDLINLMIAISIIDRNRCPVMTLVDVFVKVLDSLNA